MNDNARRRSPPIERREFLAAASGVATGMIAPSVLAGERKTPAWTMRQSTSSIHYAHLPIEQACAQIAKLGFEGVDVWSAHAGCPHLDDVQKRLGPDGLAALLAETKLKLFAFSVYSGGYRRYAELLGKAGGGVAVRGSSGPCKPAELVARMKAFLESLKPDVELAEKHNSLLAIENHGHALLHSLDSFKAFADLNRSPHLGIALAPYHLQAAGESVEKAIEISGRQLLFFYAWQRAGGARQLPGHGPTDFTPWIAALAKVKYRGYVNSFMHGELKTDAMSAALAKSRAYLKECSVSPVPGCRNISPNTNPGRCPGLSCCGPFGANSAGDVQEVIRLESTTRPMVRFTGTIRHLTTKSQPSVTSAIQRSLP